MTTIRVLPVDRHRWGLVALLVLLTAALVTLVGSGSAATTNPGSGGGIGAGVAIAPVALDPAPPDSNPAAAASPSTQAPQVGQVTSTQAPPPPAATSPTTPVLSEQDKKALGIVDYWWDTFTGAFKSTKGTKLTSAQLTKPPVVIVTKASCNQPASNLLGPKSRASFTYCGGKLELVSDVFLTITEDGQLKVVASGFLYHALDATTAAQRKYPSGKSRNDTQVLGCLQASLANALLSYQAIDDESKAWVVMQRGTTGGDLHNSYYATMDNNGVWS